MNVTPTSLDSVLILEPKVFSDSRGFFHESWNAKTFTDAIGTEVNFVQDNHSRSSKGVLRGIHFQIKKPQGKLVRVTRGAVLDVVVDLRRSSKTFGKWISVELSESNHRQVWIPPGFGHAFLVISDTADFLYKTTEFWYQEMDRAVRWNDPTIGIDWNLLHHTGLDTPILAEKDANAPLLADAETYAA